MWVAWVHGFMGGMGRVGMGVRRWTGSTFGVSGVGNLGPKNFCKSQKTGMD